MGAEERPVFGGRRPGGHGFAAHKAEHRVVSPAEFRTVAASSAEYTIIGNIVKAEANAIAAELHLAPLPGTFRKTILRCLPALRASLLAARSPNDVRAALNASREAIRALAQQEVQLNALVNGAEDAMAEKLAGRFGIEPAESCSEPIRAAASPASPPKRP